MIRMVLLMLALQLAFVQFLFATNSLVCATELNKSTVLERLGNIHLNAMLQRNPDQIGIFMSYFAKIVTTDAVKIGFRKALKTEGIFTREDQSDKFYSLPLIVFDDKKWNSGAEVPNEIKFFFEEQFYNLTPQTYEKLSKAIYHQTVSSFLPRYEATNDSAIVQYAKEWDLTIAEARDFFTITKNLRDDLGNEDFDKMVQANIIVAMPLLARHMYEKRDRTEEFQAKMLVGSQFVVPVASGLYALQVAGIDAMLWSGGGAAVGVFILGWPVAWMAGKTWSMGSQMFASAKLKLSELSFKRRLKKLKKMNLVDEDPRIIEGSFTQVTEVNIDKVMDRFNSNSIRSEAPNLHSIKKTSEILNYGQKLVDGYDFLEDEFVAIQHNYLSIKSSIGLDSKKPMVSPDAIKAQRKNLEKLLGQLESTLDKLDVLLAAFDRHMEHSIEDFDVYKESHERSFKALTETYDRRIEFLKENREQTDLSLKLCDQLRFEIAKYIQDVDSHVIKSTRDKKMERQKLLSNGD